MSMSTKPRYPIETKAMFLGKVINLNELKGKELEALTNDRFKMKSYSTIRNEDGTFQLTILMFDVKDITAEVRYLRTITMSQLLALQLMYGIH